MVPKVAANWPRLALKLGVMDSLIRDISKKHPNDCVEACLDVLYHWLREEQHTGKPDQTWSYLLTALGRAGFVQLEQDLRKKYFQGKLVLSLIVRR